jgi:hypothetical protein
MALNVPVNAFEMVFTFNLSQTGAEEDIAEFTLWLQSQDPGAPTDSDLQDSAQVGYQAWVDNTTADYWTTAVTLASCYCRTFDSAGKTAAEEGFAAGTLWQGTATSASMPWETSLAVSLYTYRPQTFVTHGRRKRGRYYLPPVAAVNLDPSNSGFFKDSQIHAFFNDQINFLSKVNRNIGGLPQNVLSVFSRVDGVCRPVTFAQIDGKFDSQRRRENRQTAGRITSDFS